MTENVVTNMFTANLMGQLREFQLNISDWYIYKARWKNYFNANDVTDEIKKKSILLNMLDEGTYKLVFNMCSPHLPETKSFTELVTGMDKYFTSQKSVLAERLKFYNSMKNAGESIKEWSARVRSLAVLTEQGRHQIRRGWTDHRVVIVVEEAVIQKISAILSLIYEEFVKSRPFGQNLCKKRSTEFSG